jgi:septum formation protein
MRRIILASTSPRRKELLAKTGLEFEVVTSNYEEDMTLALPPDELVKFLSRGKAESVASNYDDAIIIGGDTFIFFEGKILGKPHTPVRAKEMLRMLSGNEHSVFTGFTIIDTLNNKIVSEAVTAKVKFRDLSEKEIDDYVETGEPLNRAGAYAVQTVEKTFIEEVIGDYDGIIGLPINHVREILVSFGVAF